MPENIASYEDVPTVESALQLSSCRYYGIPKVKDTYIDATTLGLYNRGRSIYQDMSNFQVYEVTSKTAYRPDLISLDAYNDWRYWWMIMEANKISNLEDLRPGITLRIPPHDSITTNIDQDLQSNGDVFA